MRPVYLLLLIVRIDKIENGLSVVVHEAVYIGSGTALSIVRCWLLLEQVALWRVAILGSNSDPLLLRVL